MSEDFLPVHPATGLRALGFSKRGPIWPILGGAPENDDDIDETDADILDAVRDKVPSMTHSQCVQRCEEINGRMKDLTDVDKITDADQDEFDRLSKEFDMVNNHRKRLELKARFAGNDKDTKDLRGSNSSRFRLIPGSTQGSGSNDYDRDSILEPDSVEDRRFKNPWDLTRMSVYGREPGSVAAEYRSRALDAISKMPGANDKIREAATYIIERFDTKDSRLARQCLVTSTPAYLRAWSKLACNKGHTLTSDEQRALADVEEFRAMSLTDTAGGFLVPFQLDPTVIVTSAGVRSDIRQVARVVVATGDVWNGVSAANVAWSWDAEAAEVSDDAPTFAQPSIPNYKAAGFVPISIEAMQDEANVAQEVGKLLAGGKLDLEGTAFITGTGSGQPTGIITALVASSPTVILTSTTADTFVLGEVYKVQGGLPARYRPNASWLANNLVYNLIRAFDTSGGGGFWTNLNDDRPPLLMGRRAVEAEAMDGTVTALADNYILVFGDFENFVITDRIGMSVEFIPHLFHTANNRPSGQRGWYAYYRTGSDSVNDGGFRLLNVT